jgi:hypothetical protein
MKLLNLKFSKHRMMDAVQKSRKSMYSLCKTENKSLSLDFIWSTNKNHVLNSGLGAENRTVTFRILTRRDNKSTATYVSKYSFQFFVFCMVYCFYYITRNFIVSCFGAEHPSLLKCLKRRGKRDFFSENLRYGKQICWKIRTFMLYFQQQQTILYDVKRMYYLKL